MEYQEIANLLNDASKQPSTFKTKNWVEYMMNQEEHTMLKARSNLKPQR